MRTPIPALAFAPLPAQRPRRLSAFGVALAVAAGLAGCLEGSGPGDPVPAAEPVRFRTLAHDQDSGYASPQRAALETQAAYDAAWARHAEGPNPKGAPPPVDFARERVVLVALGQKGSGCQDVRVENVTRQGESVVVRVATYDGDVPGYGCAAVVVTPVHFVAIEWPRGSVRFEERTVHPPEAWPPGGSDAEPIGGDAEPLSTRELARGSFSGIHEDARVVVRDEAAWADLWARHGKDGARPGVSFPNESVVAVVEHGPTGCFGVHVGNVTYARGALRIEVVHERTPDNVNCIQALQDAYHFVAIPDRPGEARFVDVEGDAPATTDLPFRTLALGTTSGLHEPRGEILRNASAWADFWEEHTSGQSPRPARPEVDFAKEHVFVAMAGDKANTCWALRVERVFEDGSSLVVAYATYAPPKGTMCGQAITQPHHVVTVPVTDKPLVPRHVDREGPPPDV